MDRKKKKAEPDQNATAEEIREYYLANIPEGLFADDFTSMSDEELLQYHHVHNETWDDIFENAAEIRIYTSDKSKKVPR